MKRFILLAAAVSLIGGGSVFLLAGGVAGAKSASAASSLPTLTLGLNGGSVTVGGSQTSGAVNVVTTVTGAKQGEPALVRLNNGVSFAQFGQAVAAVNAHHGDLNYLDPYASLVYDGPSLKGTTSAQVDLQPGNYFALNVAGNGSPPHAAFVVTPSSSPASLPTPGATVSTIEFGFRGADTLHDGELVRFQNLGFLVHMDVWVRAKNLRAAHKIVALLLAGKDNKVGPKVATGFGTFTGPVSSGAVQQQIVSGAPGWYVQACFMDTQDGREHTQLGMERIFKIVK